MSASGRSVIHHGIYTPYGGGDDASGLNLTYTLLPAHLKKSYGYATVRARPGRLSALCVFHSKSVLYGGFVWARRALNRRKLWFPARAVHGWQGAQRSQRFISFYWSSIANHHRLIVALHAVAVAPGSEKSRLSPLTSRLRPLLRYPLLHRMACTECVRARAAFSSRTACVYRAGYYQGVMDYWTHSATAHAGDPEDPEVGLDEGGAGAIITPRPALDCMGGPRYGWPPLSAEDDVRRPRLGGAAPLRDQQDQGRRARAQRRAGPSRGRRGLRHGGAAGPASVERQRGVQLRPLRAQGRL
jgi:hypothetical protein